MDMKESGRLLVLSLILSSHGEDTLGGSHSQPGQLPSWIHPHSLPCISTSYLSRFPFGSRSPLSGSKGITEYLVSECHAFLKA